MDPLDQQFAGIVSYFPQSDAYPLSPDAYLEHLHRVKAAVKIPVIGSLNGTAPEDWLKSARLLEAAGADAIELNIYAVITDPNESALNVENNLRQAVADVKAELKIPIAVKLTPFFTAFGHLARELDRAGADGLVLFNRFLQPDIDIRHMAIWPRLELSDSTELLLRLQWLAILHGRLHCSLAATGGVASPTDGIKAILAGAHAVQMVSAILRHGASHFSLMRNELRQWMDAQQFGSLDEVRGRLSLARTADPSAFERAQYVRTLNDWSTLIAYQAYQRTHDDDDPQTPPS